MDCATHTRTVCDDFKNPVSPCHEVPFCVYDLKEVEENLRPWQLDGNGDTYTAVEKGAIAYALQPYEYRPGVYDLFTEETLAEIRLELGNAFSTLQRRGSAPRKQVIWLSVDPETRRRILKSKNDPEKFLDRMKETAKRNFDNLNIEFVISKNPPKTPHGIVIFSDTNNAILKRSKKRRILAVRDILYLANSNTLEILEPLFEKIRRENPDITEDNLHDKAGQNAKVEPLLPFHGGWTTLGGEDVGNGNVGDISYVRVVPERIHRKEEELEAGLLLSHEVGHALGLRHPNSVEYIEAPQCIMLRGFVGMKSKEAKKARRKKRLEVDQLVKKMDPKLLQMVGKEKLYLGLQELRTPPYRFCDQALAYLRFVLGAKDVGEKNPQL